MIELANQPFLQLVDRQAMHAVLKEHAIALSNLSDTKNALALGKFAGADFLLHVAPEEKKATIRLVEVASGQVKLEEQVALANDLALSAAAIREKVLAALRPDSQAANRLTVGIAAFTNRSGTDRSDKFGIELQKALRSRLKEKAWAVVLERQYPTSLLEEVDLARAGLVRDNAVEKLPPADLVIFGRMEDADREYEPGKPWAVKLDLTLRLRGHSSYVSETCRSDALEAAADHITGKIDEFRRQPASQRVVAEKELWRRQALYLMPRQLETWPFRQNVLIPNFYWSSELNDLEVIRAWENVLLLDEHDADAMTYLGVYLINCNRGIWNVGNVSLAKKRAAAARCVAGSRLVERALRMQPTFERAACYIFCMRPLIDVAPARGKEMGQYVFHHPEQFKGIPDFFWIKVAQTKSLRATGDPDFAELERALSNAEKDPNAVLILFPPRLTRKGPAKEYSKLLNRYLDSPNPVVQFAVHRALGELLCWQEGDPAALPHFDAAIAALEAAYQRCQSVHRNSLNDIYWLRIEASELLGRPEEAKKTALAGVKHFMAIPPSRDFDNRIGWLYRYCVTEVLGKGQEQQALDICNTYCACAKRYWECNDWPRISAKREELLAKLAGKPLPDTSNLRFIAGTAAYNNADLRSIRMAATDGKVWLVSAQFSTGSAMLWRHDSDAAKPLSFGASSVAVGKGAIFFGSGNGLYKLDTNGKLLKHFDQNDLSLPGYGIIDVCEGGGKLYFAFRGSPLKGIAVLDPATEKITILAPSGREATRETEPVTAGIGRIRWDAATGRLYVFGYTRCSNNPPKLVNEYGWSPQDKLWQRYPINEAPRFVVSDGNEALLVRVVGDQTEFQFVKAGQKLTAAVPVPSLLGEPAWDERRIWVPTASGLYEVDRATSHVRWLAYQDGNAFLSLLKHGNWLYVATAHGLYYAAISPTGLIPPPAGPSAPAESPPRPGLAAAGNSHARRTTVQGANPASGSAVISLAISLENNVDAVITITADKQRTLKETHPGTVQLDVATLKNGTHLLYFHCPGYAAQWIRMEVVDGRTVSNGANVKLFRKRYVILRCALNADGGRNLVGAGVEEQHLALSHWTGPEDFSHDWRIWQKSNEVARFRDTPYLEIKFGRIVKDFGFAKPGPGVSYENMKQAPKSGYRCEDVKAEKGLVLYCRVNGGGGKQGFGYGKLMVEDVTETPPKDIRVVDAP